MNADRIKSHARSLGFDLVGVAGVGPTPEALFYPEWLERGYAGEMQYLERQAPARLDVRQVLPDARSVIVCAVNYNTDRARTTFDRARAWISRYAWGEDYHETLQSKLRDLGTWIDGNFDASTKTYVDTGPLLERVFARYAGVGWF